jgi:hypothetical protein
VHRSTYGTTAAVRFAVEVSEIADRLNESITDLRDHPTPVERTARARTIIRMADRDWADRAAAAD